MWFRSNRRTLNECDASRPWFQNNIAPFFSSFCASFRSAPKNIQFYAFSMLWQKFVVWVLRPWAFEINDNVLISKQRKHWLLNARLCRKFDAKERAHEHKIEGICMTSTAIKQLIRSWGNQVAYTARGWTPKSGDRYSSSQTLVSTRDASVHTRELPIFIG